MNYPMQNMSNMPMPNMPMPNKPMQQTITVCPVDPYVVEALKSLMGKNIMLETTRGRINGCVLDVKPDHVVLDARGRKFFVRISEVVWILPE